MARAVLEAHSLRPEPGARRCMGTVVLDDPRVGGARAEAPGDSNRGREDARQPPPTAADARDRQHADRGAGRRRAQ